ncbi:MAG: cytochrome c biogenesis protein [Candidatus Kapabacteria bacterium]|jgi:heme exporter protein C|nr:cytochrome c biogenesis protein [Candidatus Kapabacteria bacterium]
MKFLIQFSGVALGLLLSLYIPLEKPRPVWWKWLVVLMLTVTTIFALAPRTAGTFADAVLMRRVGAANPVVPVKVLVNEAVKQEQSEVEAKPVATMPLFTMTDFRENDPVQAMVRVPQNIASQLASGQVVILQMERDSLGADNMFTAKSLVATSPWLTLPYIPQLEERARNLYFHVPMSWVAMLAYVVAMVFGFRYLKTRDISYDIKSSAAAALGTLFTILATVTGAIWAKFNWGEFWNWDPRQTSIFILLLMYGAYFALRQAIDNDERCGRLSAVYVIFAVVPAVFLMFIMPRILDGLHPGAGNDSNAGPLLSANKDDLNIVKQVIFSLAFGGFTMLFFWMLSLQVRIKQIELFRRNDG